jgi:hypothetical protein
LRELNTLDELAPPTQVDAGDRRLELVFDLPMPGISCLHFESR